jgi:hypothetical protein
MKPLGLNPYLLIAGVRARQTRVMSDIVADSIERMAEAREKRAEEREERERVEDRLRALETLERADAEAAARSHERRRSFYADLGESGDELAMVRARSEQRAAEAERVRARGAGLDTRG